jgi:hypothetical protein
MKASRVLFLFIIAAFITVGTPMAQTAPPQPASTGAAKAPKPTKKCKQSPKGCHKKQSGTKPAGSAMPQGSPPRA